MMNKQQPGLQVDISQTEEVVCEACGNTSFCDNIWFKPVKF